MLPSRMPGYGKSIGKQQQDSIERPQKFLFRGNVPYSAPQPREQKIKTSIRECASKGGAGRERQTSSGEHLQFPTDNKKLQPMANNPIDSKLPSHGAPPGEQLVPTGIPFNHDYTWTHGAKQRKSQTTIATANQDFFATPRSSPLYSFSSDSGGSCFQGAIDLWRRSLSFPVGVLAVLPSPGCRKICCLALRIDLVVGSLCGRSRASGEARGLRSSLCLSRTMGSSAASVFFLSSRFRNDCITAALQNSIPANS